MMENQVKKLWKEPLIPAEAEKVLECDHKINAYVLKNLKRLKGYGYTHIEQENYYGGVPIDRMIKWTVKDIIGMETEALYNRLYEMYGDEVANIVNEKIMYLEEEI